MIIYQGINMKLIKLYFDVIDLFCKIFQKYGFFFIVYFVMSCIEGLDIVIDI